MTVLRSLLIFKLKKYLKKQIEYFTNKINEINSKDISMQKYHT